MLNLIRGKYKVFIAIIVIFIVSTVVIAKLSAVSFSKEEFIEDYIYVWKVIEENYPFYLDMDKIRAKNKEDVDKIMNSEKFTLKDFYNLLSSSINSHIGHLYVVTLEGYYMFKKILYNYSEEFPEADYLYNKINSSKTYISYIKLDPFARFKNKMKANKNVKDNIFTLVEDNIAYIQIKSFQKEYLENDKIKLFDFYDENKDRKYIIFDIRDNGGGTDEYWIKNIVEPNIDKPLMQEKYSFIKNGKETMEYIKKFKEFESSIIEKETVESLENFDPKLISDNNIYLESVIEVKPLSTEKRLNGKIFILINRGTYSAADSFAQFAKDTGFGKIIGTPSLGGGGGWSLNMVVLPNTGLCFNYSIEHILNSGGSSHDLNGTIPDYILKGNEDIIEIIKTMD